MAEKIKVIIKRPGEMPYSTWVSNRLENLQLHVGGYIEAIGLSDDLAVICDEEGRLKGKPYNCNLAGLDLVGDIMLVGVKGEEFADLPVDYHTMRKLFPELWMNRSTR